MIGFLKTLVYALGAKTMKIERDTDNIVQLFFPKERRKSFVNFTIS